MMENVVNFKQIFLENSLLSGDEQYAVDFFISLKNNLNYEKDKNFLDYLSQIAQIVEAKSFIQELKSLSVPCDNLTYKFVDKDFDSDEENFYDDFENDYTKEEFEKRFKTLDSAFLSPTQITKDEYTNEIYSLITSNNNAVFSAYDFSVFANGKYLMERRVLNSIGASFVDKIKNKAFAYKKEDFDDIGSVVCKKIEINSLNILYSKIDATPKIKEKIIEYFENNSFYISSNSSVSPSKNIFDAINDLKYYHEEGSSTYIQNEKNNDILLSLAFFEQSNKEKIDLFFDVVSNVKKQLYKTYNENLEPKINEDFLKSKGVVVFKDGFPLAVYTNDDFENKLITWDKLEKFDTVLVIDLFKDLNNPESIFKDKKVELIQQINSIFAEKEILEYLPNKFEAEVKSEKDFKLIQEKLKPIGSIINYTTKESSDLNGGTIVIYTDKNKESLLEVISDVDIFTESLEQKNTNLLEDGEKSIKKQKQR